MLKSLQKLAEYQPLEEFRPLQITFQMASPICLAHPWIAFDGLLAHLLLRKLLGDEYRAFPSKSPVDISGLKLPIKHYKSIQGSFYHASSSVIKNNDYYATKIYKRFHERDVHFTKSTTKRISKASGHFKDFMISLLYIPTEEVEFFVNGNKQEIKELLQGLPGIGKKTDIGFGFYKSVNIEEIEQDRSLISEGKAMRPLPKWILSKHQELAYLAYSFPYWDRKKVALCAPPGTEVRIRG